MPATLRPASVEELSAALRDTSGAVAVTGSGTKAGWGAAGAEPEVVIDTTALDRVVEHAAGDLVVTVEAGVALEHLQQVIGAHRQWLALDPPWGGTIGGVLATAASGPRRLRFGSPRDLLLGVTVVLADGTVAHSGGKVVKNVAGYDLGKLFTGSLGTLGVIASATLRLHPTFVSRRVVSASAPQPWPLVREVLRSPATPTAIEWHSDALVVLVESSEAAVDAQAGAVASAIGGDVTDGVPEWFTSPPHRSGDMLLKLTFRLSALDAVMDAVRTAAAGAVLRSHAGNGVLWVATAPSADVVADLRVRTASYDGTVVVVDGPQSWKNGVDVWGPVRGLDVMRRIKAQFDPDARMNAGRFVGGI